MRAPMQLVVADDAPPLGVRLGCAADVHRLWAGRPSAVQLGRRGAAQDAASGRLGKRCGAVGVVVV